jgi:hypothetical protein
VKVSKYNPKSNTPLLEKPQPLRSAREVEAELAERRQERERATAVIAASVDFLCSVVDDAEKQQIRRRLRSKP